MFDAQALARKSDPSTSHAAAVEAVKFRETHYSRILRAMTRLADQPQIGCTAGEIAQVSGLTVEQIDRRMVELQRRGQVFVYQYAGGDLVRGGYRCWGTV